MAGMLGERIFKGIETLSPAVVQALEAAEFDDDNAAPVATPQEKTHGKGWSS